MIEQILDEKEVPITHNKIHRILLEECLAKKEQKKKKLRAYKSYQRKNGLSLVHVNWFEFRRKKLC